MAILYGDPGNVATNDILFTDAPNSVWYGGQGNDIVYSFLGSGDFYGGTGNDYIQNQSASTTLDRMYGGEGDDVIRDFEGSSTMEGGGGIDALYGSTANDRIFGGDDSDSSAFTVTAGTGAVGYTITKEGGLYGNSGNDYLDGGAGNDTLFGGDDDDRLYGGDDNDLVEGDLGRDLLWGGAGGDTFRFLSTAESPKGPLRDIVRDFDRTEGDRIDLSAIDANSGTPIDDPFKFIKAKPFHDKPGELHFKNGILSGDGDGNGKADFDIKVAGLTKMIGTDFVL